MRFGITYNLEYVPEVHLSEKRYMDLILEQTVLLDQLGFDSQKGCPASVVFQVFLQIGKIEFRHSPRPFAG